MFCLILISCFIIGINSLNSHDCPKVQGVPLDLNKLSDGIWWEYARSDYGVNDSEVCARQTWLSPVDGATILVDESYSLRTNVLSRTVGEVRVLSDNGLSFNFDLPFLGKIHETHTVLDVDYQSYAVSYYCGIVGDDRHEKVWILTRERNPSINIGMILNRAFNKNGLKVPHFTIIENENCF